MTPIGITVTLQARQLSIESIEVDEVREGFIRLLNLVEALAGENEQLREEKQILKDEINRLKGEQSEPTIKGRKCQGDSKSKGQSSRRGRGSKLDRIKIDRVQTCSVDRNELPSDVVFKGYERVIIQDMQIITDAIEFKREIFYSLSQKETYRGQPHRDCQGAFGPEIKALIVAMKPQCNMSEPKIVGFLLTFEVDISRAYIAKWLGVNVYNYFYGRISRKFTLPSLSQLISEKSTSAATT